MGQSEKKDGAEKESRSERGPKGFLYYVNDIETEPPASDLVSIEAGFILQKRQFLGCSIRHSVAHSSGLHACRFRLGCRFLLR